MILRILFLFYLFLLIEFFRLFFFKFLSPCFLYLILFFIVSLSLYITVLYLKFVFLFPLVFFSFILAILVFSLNFHTSLIFLFLLKIANIRYILLQKFVKQNWLWATQLRMFGSRPGRRDFSQGHCSREFCGNRLEFFFGA